MTATSPSLLLKISVISVITTLCFGNYVITTPRKWTSGETVQVCSFILNSTSTENSITVAVTSVDGSEHLIPNRVIQIPEGKTELCEKVFVPPLRRDKGLLEITGSLGGKQVQYKKDILLVYKVAKTFVQTDKFLYKPNQDVRFRILTVVGPFLKISTDKYPLIWVETPSGSRIAQWRDVNNTGLIHQSFILSDEPEEGTYKIHVNPPNGEAAEVRTFKVEEYVLPRFDVTLEPPNYILGTDKKFKFTVCARYTYGQPVKGNVMLKVDNGGWGSSKIIHTVNEQIFGCKDIEVLAEAVDLNGEDYIVQSLAVTATVVEEGTEQELQKELKVDIHRTVLSFTSTGKEEFQKPNLPFTGQVRVTFPDGSPAGGKLMEVCAEGKCKNITTSSNGVLDFIVPLSISKHIQIKAVDYPSVKNPVSNWRPIMYESIFMLHVKSYHSPSRSSLIIYAPKKHLPCSTEYRELTIPIMFAAVNQNRATVTVQVVSRGQIQFSRTEEHELLPTDLPLDEAHLVEPLPEPPQNVVRGFIEIPIRLPPTASPRAKVVVWYTRDDGEVVPDSREVDINKCFWNKVNLSWSNSRVQPGEQVNLDLSAEPESICSLGVVDKSVELLSSKNDHLTVDRVFEIVEKSMIQKTENPQVDDYIFCARRDWKHDKEPSGPPSVPAGIPGSNFPEAVPFNPELEPAGVPVEDLTAVRMLSQHFLVKRSGAMRWRLFSYSDEVDALKIFDNAGLYFFTDLITETRPCTRNREGPPWISYAAGMSVRHPLFESPRVRVANAAVADHLLIINEHNEVDSVTPPSQKIPTNPRVYFPETWLWQLSTLPVSGVSSEQLTLPDTITEWVGKAVCVHPDKGLGVSEQALITTFTPFFIDLTLPPSVKRGEIFPVKISVFNYLEEALPVKVQLVKSAEYVILEDLESGQPENQRSSCIPPQDKVVHSVKVRALSLGEVNLTVIASVDEVYPEVCGSEYVISKSDHIVKPITVHVEGFPREKTWTKYICSKDIEENVDSLEKWNIETPTEIIQDSARGWVSAVGDLLGPTLENLGSLVRMPYGCGEQNMLNFAPNIFILQYLDASNQSTPSVGEKAVTYMKQGYQRELKYRHEDGSFSAFGKSDNSGSTWLTAFVLKSFAQARQFILIDGNDLDMSRDWLKRKQMENGCFESVGKVFHKGMKGGLGDDSSPVPLTAYVLISLLEAGEPPSSAAISEAAFCLLADQSQDPYTAALKAYALALSGLSEAQSVIEKVINTAMENSHSMHWEIPAGAGKSEGVEIETAGYTLLAMMTLNATRFQNQAVKIVKFLSSKRNGQGGFISTQDTVVALQALASFESHQNQGNVNLVITVEAEALEHDFHIDESNKLLQQTANLPKIPAHVVFGLTGEGCALVQAVLRYNVPESSPSEAFRLSVTTETAPDKKCVTKRIKICASYQLPDKKSNMAVIEVDLISGYIPEKADLKQIVGYGTGLFKRYEVDGSTVTFYIDEFSPEDICLSFRIIREIEVQDVKPGTVKVYDYYQPEFSVSTSFVLPPIDECKSESEINIEGIIPFENENVEGEPAGSTDVNPADVDDLLSALDGSLK
ncbi:alpha-2-macroglobulin-like [Cherax quadricarinatus]